MGNMEAQFSQGCRLVVEAGEGLGEQGAGGRAAQVDAGLSRCTYTFRGRSPD